MAIISEHLQLTNIGDDVVLIQYPGYDEEKILFRYPMMDAVEARKVMEQMDTMTFTSEEKRNLFFWMGYFYAHGIWQSKN